MVNQFNNPYYMSPYQQTLPTQQNYLPQQQILQVNSKESLQSMRTAPNSSYLVADANKNLIYKVVSDSLGNNSVSTFVVSPYKDEEETKHEQSDLIIADLVRRIERLENESNSKWSKSIDAEYEANKTNDGYGKDSKQSARNGKTNDAKQS